MPPIFRFIAGSWGFLWRQPALIRAVALLIFLPLTAMHGMGVVTETVGAMNTELLAILTVLNLAATAVLAWGIACVLIVGRRFLRAKAGRSRTSFTAVRHQARGFVIPLLLTNILGGCLTILRGIPLALFVLTVALIADTHHSTLLVSVEQKPWLVIIALLLALPPILYGIQTILTPLIVVYEKLSFRTALNRSRTLVRTRLVHTIIVLIALSLLWVPGIIIETLIIDTAPPAIARATVSLARELLDTCALVLWLLTLTQFYKALGGNVRKAYSHNEADDE